MTPFPVLDKEPHNFICMGLTSDIASPGWYDSHEMLSTGKLGKTLDALVATLV